MNKLNLKTFKYLITIMKYPKCLQSSGEASEDAIAQYIGPEVIENDVESQRFGLFSLFLYKLINEIKFP
jgi:hypothetical protein